MHSILRSLHLYQMQARTGIFLPHSDVVVDGLGVQHSKVNGDSVAWWDPDAPCAVLQVGVIIRMTWRVDGALQSSEISTTKC